MQKKQQKMEERAQSLLEGMQKQEKLEKDRLKSKKKRQDEFQFQIDRTRERFFNNDQKRKTLEREFYLSK